MAAPPHFFKVVFLYKQVFRRLHRVYVRLQSLMRMMRGILQGLQGQQDLPICLQVSLQV